MQTPIAHKIFLASKSPRRSFLLSEARIEFELISIDVDESISSDIPVAKAAETIALKKANAVNTKDYKSGILLTADTVVLNEGCILGKPKSKEEAIDMLAGLTDKKHEVITGVCLRDHEKEVVFSDSSIVTLSSMTIAEIEFYVEQYRPFDKAGAYGIQDWIGWCKIQRIEGSYANIMGLPVARIYGALLNW